MRIPIKTIMLLALLNIAAKAQPVLQSNMPPYGYFGYIFLGTNVPAAGSGGAGVTWDFSFQSSFNNIGKVTYVDIGGTEFEADFGTCNLVERKEIAGDTIFTYYTDLGSSLIINGENMGSMAPSDYSNNTKTLLNFPMNYGDSLTDSWTTTLQGKVKRKYDGYGTLITMFNTFNNVARVQTIDSVLVGANWVQTVSYTWYTTDHIIPVAYYNNTSQQMTLYKLFPVSVRNTENNTQVSLAPNPMREQASLHIDNVVAGMKLVITNAIGQVVRVQVISRPTTIIERGALNNGMYFYRLESKEGIAAQGKLVIE